MKKTCIIHIGMPKTGTSSLQAALFAARGDLLEKDINYFSFSDNHNLLAESFDGPTENTFRQKKIVAVRRGGERIKNALIKEVKKNTCSKFIISGEGLGMMYKVQVQSLRDLLDPYFDEFLIVAYVREPFGYARSAAQQHIKAGSTSEKIISNTLKRDQPGWGNVLPTYRRRLEFFADVFGKKNTKVREFRRSELKNEDILDDFIFEFLNYSGKAIKFKRIVKNESLDATLGTLYEKLNDEIPVWKNGKLNRKRSVEFLPRLMKFSKNQRGGAAFVLSDLNPDDFLKVIKDDLNWLEKEYGIKFQLKKPNWSTQDVDLSRMALLTHHLSELIDEKMVLLKKEKVAKADQQALRNRESGLRQFTHQRLLILKNRGDAEWFKRVASKVEDVDFLIANAKALRAEGNIKFSELAERRVRELDPKALPDVAEIQKPTQKKTVKKKAPIPKKPAEKKVSSKKTVAKKVTPKKAVTKKVTPKKTSAKKTTRKKPVAKKVVVHKATPKKSSGKKVVSEKVTVKKPSKS